MKITKVKGNNSLEKAEHGDGSAVIFKDMKIGICVAEKTQTASRALKLYNDFLILNQVKNN